MEFLQLKYFYETAQNESIAKTAKKFMVPASSVSASIKRLEQELNTVLFERSSNRIRLNQKGTLLYEGLIEIFDKLDDTLVNINKEQKESKIICILIKARRKWITDLIIEYKQTHPDVQFRIFNDNTVENNDRFDIIIDEQSDEYENKEHFLLSVEEICIKASSESPLAGHKLNFKSLRNQPFIMPGKAIGIRKLLETTGQKHGFTPNITIECNDSYCLNRYVKADMGLTLGSMRALESEFESGIVKLDVTDFCEVQAVYVYHRKISHKDAATAEFCEFLRKKRQK